MFRVSSLRAAAIAAVIALSGSPSAASAQDSTMQDAQKQAVEGIGKLLEALQMFVKSVPQYSAPEVLPNGDIIIRRVPQKPEPAPEKPQTDDDTSST
ncbi:hypothetical protein [Dongia sp.]|uniref:hypothetical protein n=1 Tax=Dongia sp. TaxID=1977262 RepID=UPI00374FDE3F